MTLHSLCDHVVHVELLSSDPEISRAALDLLTEVFGSREADATGADGVLQLRSEPADPVSAAEVAQVLLAAGVRTHTVHERVEWSVVDVPDHATRRAGAGGAA